ncbi:hypothetical protein TcWFU_006551 [Taenia crassiceps]|uniref:Uncharacterized protein n=1 Tax=Taenia crassiceps TaxID=6207 RepID=A0ABR4Q3F0_9CEST
MRAKRRPRGVLYEVNVKKRKKGEKREKKKKKKERRSQGSCMPPAACHSPLQRGKREATHAMTHAAGRQAGRQASERAGGLPACLPPACLRACSSHSRKQCFSLFSFFSLFFFFFFFFFFFHLHGLHNWLAGLRSAVRHRQADLPYPRSRLSTTTFSHPPSPPPPPPPPPPPITPLSDGDEVEEESKKAKDWTTRPTNAWSVSKAPFQLWVVLLCPTLNAMATVNNAVEQSNELAIEVLQRPTGPLHWWQQEE